MHNVTSNSTLSEFFWVPTVAQFTFGVFGNVIALILLILSRKQHKWISFYRLYTGLVITDLSYWLLAYPSALARYASRLHWEYSSVVCEYNSFMNMFGVLSSAFMVCAMSVDRMKAMCSRKDEHHGKLYVGILVLIWLLTGLYSGLHLLTKRTRLYYPGTWCYFDYFNSTNDTAGKVNVYSYAVLGLTAIFLIVMLNFLMLFLACCNSELRSRLTDRHRITGGYDCHSYFFLAIVASVYVFMDPSFSKYT